MSIISINTKKGANLAGTQLQIIVDGTDFEELTNANTRGRVLTFARSVGFPVSGLSSLPRPFPVDKDGETKAEMLSDPQNNPWDHWRAEYEVNAGLR